MTVYTFPAGKKQIVKATGIAGNVDTTKTIPAGKKWLLLNIMIELTTDGNPADRYPTVICQDAANIKKFSVTASAVTASLTRSKFYNPSITSYGADLNALGRQILEPAEDVVLSIVNGLAGDAYDYLIEYLEIDRP